MKLTESSSSPQRESSSSPQKPVDRGRGRGRGHRRGRGRQGHRNPIRRGNRRRGGAVVYGPNLPTREELNQIRREERNTQLRVRAFIHNIYFRIL